MDLNLGALDVYSPSNYDPPTLVLISALVGLRNKKRKKIIIICLQ